MDKPFFLQRLSIKSKFLLMLLSIALFCITIIGYQGINHGQKSLTRNIYNQLSSLRDNRAKQVADYLNNKQQEIAMLSDNLLIIEAMSAFHSAHTLLETYRKNPLNNTQNQDLIKHYKNQYLQKFAEISHQQLAYEDYLPADSTTRYLQYHYLVKNHFHEQERRLFKRAPDNSYYSQVHERYHKNLLSVADKLGFEDIFLIKAEGEILYSVNKRVDFASDILRGPFYLSSLAQVVRDIRQQPKIGSVQLADFKPYAPRYGKASAFIAAPIFHQQSFIGILAAELDSKALDDMMTGDKGWHNDGLGQSGEVYLVGEDLHMRSTSRLLLEDSEKYQQRLKQIDTPAAQLAHIMSLNSPVGYQQVDTEASRAAIQAQQTGRKIILNEYGDKVLSAFAPVNISGLNWGIIAQKNVAEVDKPVLAFERTLLISAVLQAAFIAVISLYLAYRFVQPIGTLIKGLQRISAGESKFKLQLQRHDEFAELADAFNDMTNNINQQQNKIAEKNQETQNLLANSVPKHLLNRFNTNAPYLADTYHNVAILCVHVNGLNADDMDMNPILNEWTMRFYDLCREFDTDSMPPVGNLYLSACGLSVPRLDQAKRSIDLALALNQEINRLNLRYNLYLHLCMGVHRGDVQAGMLGERPFAYNIWGDVVQIAQRLSLNTHSNSIKITEVVYNQLLDNHDFVETNPLSGTDLKLWLMQIERGLQDEHLLNQKNY